VNALADVGNGPSEEVAAENHCADPKNAAENVVDEVTGVRHLRSAGDGRAKRANDGDEARENDRFSAISFIEVVGALEMALAEEERVLALVQRGARGAANPVANLVADNGAEHNRQENPFQRNDTRGGKDAGRDEQGIAGKEKANKEPGFDEDNKANEKRSTGANYSFDIVDGMQQVADRFEQTSSSLRNTGMGTTALRQPLRASEQDRKAEKSVPLNTVPEKGHALSTFPPQAMQQPKR